MEQEQLTPEQKIQTEIRLHEAEARLCRRFAVQIPEQATEWLDRAEVCETAAHNASLFLKGRGIRVEAFGPEAA